MCIHDSASFSSRVSISGRVRGPFECEMHGSLGSKQSCPLLVRGQLKVSQTEDSRRAGRAWQEAVFRVGPANTRSLGVFFWKNSLIHLKYSFWGIVIWVTCQRQILSHIIKVENDVERSGSLKKKKCFLLSFSAKLFPDHKRAKVITSGASRCAKKICKSMHYHSAGCWYRCTWPFPCRLGSEVFWCGLLTGTFQRLHSANCSNYWSDCAPLYVYGLRDILYNICIW